MTDRGWKPAISEPVVRDDRFVIEIIDMGDCAFAGKLLVRHVAHGLYDEWPGQEKLEHPACARAYELECESAFLTVDTALLAAEAFLDHWGSGDVQWFGSFSDKENGVVACLHHRGVGYLEGWVDRADPTSEVASR